MDKLLLTVNEACEVLSVRRTTIYDLLSSGDLLSAKVGPKQSGRRILVSSIEGYVRRQTE